MNRLRADGLLLLVALVWGSSFVVQRVAARYFDLFTFNGLRFLLGGLILLPFSKINLLKRPKGISAAKLPNANHSDTLTGRVRKSILFMLLAGGLLFGSAGFQQLGFESTTAGNAGFIGSISTAVDYTLQGFGQRIAPPTDATILLSMESVFAALTGFVFLGEKLVSLQLVGCSLIIVAVFITQMRSINLRGLSI